MSPKRENSDAMLNVGMVWGANRSNGKQGCGRYRELNSLAKILGGGELRKAATAHLKKKNEDKKEEVAKTNKKKAKRKWGGGNELVSKSYRDLGLTTSAVRTRPPNLIGLPKEENVNTGREQFWIGGKVVGRVGPIKQKIRT